MTVMVVINISVSNSVSIYNKKNIPKRIISVFLKTVFNCKSDFFCIIFKTNRRKKKLNVGNKYEDKIIERNCETK
jgi:hypothetical protein